MKIKWNRDSLHHLHYFKLHCCYSKDQTTVLRQSSQHCSELLICVLKISEVLNKKL